VIPQEQHHLFEKERVRQHQERLMQRHVWQFCGFFHAEKGILND